MERWSATENARQPVDLVAPEVDAHRVVVGRRVDVDDRAAHRDLAARLDLVLAPVAAGDERLDQLVAVDPPARAHDDRLDLLDVGPEPLHQRPHRRDDDRGPRARRWRSRQRTRRRRPIVSSDGDTRSNGSVSHAGNSSTSPTRRAGAEELARSRARRSASAPVGTATHERPAGRDRRERGDEQRPGRVGDRHRRRTRR